MIFILFIIMKLLVVINVECNKIPSESTAANILTTILAPHQPSSKITSASYTNTGVSCDAAGCSEIGTSILAEGGSVADAGIATVFCMGVIHPQALGIGGGFLALMYNASTGQSLSLNARETAGSKATQDMFHGDPKLSQLGPLAVGVPGQLKGLSELHKKAGKLPWARLIQPSIQLARNGFRVTKTLAKALKEERNNILNSSTMRADYINPITGDVWKVNDVIKLPRLAKTLKIIAESPLRGDELYVGQLGKDMIQDLSELGGILTLKDMANYKVLWENPITVKLSGKYTIHTMPPPGSGIILAFILNILEDYLPPGGFKSLTTYQRIVEAFKHAYAKRTFLGDYEGVEKLVKKLTSKDYAISIRRLIKDDSTNNSYSYYGAYTAQKIDQGTGHVSIIGPNGDAMSITTTINGYFGAQIVSKRTGIVLNNQMDDFSSPNITNYWGLPPSPFNFIRPGKRPASSSAPSIFTDDTKKKVRLVIGAEGGSKITTSIALVSIRNLWFGEGIKDSIRACRIHHQLYPMEVQYEEGFPQNFLKGLRKIGHATMKSWSNFCSAVALNDKTGHVDAASDLRTSGSVSGF